MKKRNLLFLSVISFSCLGCSSTRPEFSQIDSFSCDCQDDSISYEPVQLKCNVSIVGEDGLVSHKIEVRKGEDISGKIKTQGPRAEMYDGHPTTLYKIESGGELVKASLLYCYDGVTPSLSVINAEYSEFFKDDYLFGEYTNQKGEKLYIYDYHVECTYGDYSFYSKEIYSPNPQEVLVKDPILKRDGKKIDLGDQFQSNISFGPLRANNNQFIFDVTSISIRPDFLINYFEENNIEYNIYDYVYWRYNERAVSFS